MPFFSDDFSQRAKAGGGRMGVERLDFRVGRDDGYDLQATIGDLKRRGDALILALIFVLLQNIIRSLCCKSNLEGLFCLIRRNADLFLVIFTCEAAILVPFLIGANTQPAKHAAKDLGARGLEFSWEETVQVPDLTELVFGLITDGASCQDARTVFWCDVVMKEVIEEIADGACFRGHGLCRKKIEAKRHTRGKEPFSASLEVDNIQARIVSVGRHEMRGRHACNLLRCVVRECGLVKTAGESLLPTCDASISKILVKDILAFRDETAASTVTLDSGFNTSGGSVHGCDLREGATLLAEGYRSVTVSTGFKTGKWNVKYP